MAVAKKTKMARGRKQDRARVAGGQDYEVRYEVEEDGPVRRVREEGRQEGRQCPQARGQASSSQDSSAAGHCGGHSGQVSPIESSTSRTSATASSGETPDGGSRRACREGAFAGVRVGAVLHPAVLLALADGAGFLQNTDRPAAQCPDRRPPFLRHQHRDRSCRDESLCPVVRSSC